MIKECKFLVIRKSKFIKNARIYSKTKPTLKSCTRTLAIKPLPDLIQMKFLYRQIALKYLLQFQRLPKFQILLWHLLTPEHCWKRGFTGRLWLMVNSIDNQIRKPTTTNQPRKEKWLRTEVDHDFTLRSKAVNLFLRNQSDVVVVREYYKDITKL